MEAPLKNNRGFITLLSTLIVTVFGMALAYSFLARSGIHASTGIVTEKLFLARNYADACVEEALRMIEDTSGYSGSGDLEFNRGSCSYTVSVAGSTSIIESEGYAEDAVRRVRAEVDTETIEEEGGSVTNILDVSYTEPAEF